MATLLTPRRRKAGRALPPESGGGGPRPWTPLLTALGRGFAVVHGWYARVLRWLGGVFAPLAAVVRRGLAPIGARLSPVVGLFTSLGRAAVLVALAGVVVGVLLGWVELAAVAVALVAALLLGAVFVIGRPSYAVRLGLASVRVVVGERAVGDLHVRNTAQRSAAPSLIELPVGRAVASLPIPRLDPDAEHEELFTIPTQHRAVLPLGPVRSVRQDPLELLRREVMWTEPQEIFVHPRTVRLDNASTGFIRDLEGLATRDLSNDDVSFHALREYVPGDDLRYVHWRSTARTNKLMIRQFEETRRSQVVIVLATRPADYADPDEFELAISCAASLSRSAQSEGKEVTVFTSDVALAGPTPDSLLDAYSGIEPSPSRESLGDRARVVGAEVPSASVVILITGSGTPAEQLRLASIRVPAIARCFGIRAATAEELSRKAVGDFALVSLPRLEDLPMAVRVATA